MREDERAPFKQARLGSFARFGGSKRPQRLCEYQVDVPAQREVLPGRSVRFLQRT